MSSILGIAVDVPLRLLFDYRCPSGIDPARLQPGVRCWVPFGRRRVAGVLVEVRNRSDLPDSKLRSALSVIDDQPVLDARLLDLLRWSAYYYRHPPGEVIAAALPAPLRNGSAALELQERWALTAAAPTGQLPPLSSRARLLVEITALGGGRRIPRPSTVPEAAHAAAAGEAARPAHGRRSRSPEQDRRSARVRGEAGARHGPALG